MFESRKQSEEKILKILREKQNVLKFQYIQNMMKQHGIIPPKDRKD